MTQVTTGMSNMFATARGPPCDQLRSRIPPGLNNGRR
jgi:hypothetical protein